MTELFHTGFIVEGLKKLPPFPLVEILIKDIESGKTIPENELLTSLDKIALENSETKFVINDLINKIKKVDSITADIPSLGLTETQYLKNLSGIKGSVLKFNDLRWQFLKFKKNYINEDFAREIFSDLYKASVSNSYPFQKVISDFLSENDPEKIRREAIVTDSQLTLVDSAGFYLAMIKITVKDYKNPGVAIKREMQLNTKKRDRQAAQSVLSYAVKDIVKDIVNQLNQRGKNAKISETD